MRCRIAAACVVLLGAADRAAAFGGHRAAYPVAVGPPVWVVPYYAVPLVEVVPAFGCPVPCCPAPVGGVPAAPTKPPQVQQMPPTTGANPGPKPGGLSGAGGDAGAFGKGIDPASVAIPKAADPTVSGEPKPPNSPAIPSPSVPTRPEEPLQLPREVPGLRESPVIPKLDPPKMPDAVPPANPDDSRFPPLKLTPPPDGTTSESKSSPLVNEKKEPRFEVFPVVGVAPVGGVKAVGIHNRTGRVISLTVQGETVAVPNGRSITARVPASFTWKLDADGERAETLPADSPGAEIIVRR